MPETSIELKVSPSIFYSTHECKSRIIVHQGGQWSGKTVNILISLACHAQKNTSSLMGLGNEVITITSESIPHLKGGALRDFDRYVLPYFAPYIKQYNKQDYIITFNNGSLIEFKSFDDENKALGAKRTRLFINEANRFNYMTFFQLNSRTEIQTIIDYNPAAKFWVHDEVLGSPGTELFISDHRHNDFLSEAKHTEIENIKDPELWKVYARGKTGNVLGTIFPNWTVVNDFPDEDGVFWGLDFGYTNDPTALVKLVRIANSLFVHECCYEAGLSPTQIVVILKANGWKDDEPVYCEHDADIIRQLRELDVAAYAAKKGPGSIKAGIAKLKEYDVFYTYRSTNLKEELKRYVWMMDKDTGKPTNIPTPGWDHLLDAVRYGVFTNFWRG